MKTDTAGVERSYQRIGRKKGKKAYYETALLQAAAVVRQELAKIRKNAFTGGGYHQTFPTYQEQA
jgi:hypothetical protein